MIVKPGCSKRLTNYSFSPIDNIQSASKLSVTYYIVMYLSQTCVTYTFSRAKGNLGDNVMFVLYTIARPG